jgi:hypothetical protein
VSRDLEITEIVDRVSKTRGSVAVVVVHQMDRVCDLYRCRTFWRRPRLLRGPLPQISRHPS